MLEQEVVRRWPIPLTEGGNKNIEIKNSDRLFIVGANGTGKSALIQHGLERLGKPIRRMSAHRQNWMVSSHIELNSRSRREMETRLHQRDVQHEGRWKDDQAGQRLAAILFDLVAAENERSRRVTELIDAKKADAAVKQAADTPSPFLKINDLLAAGNFSVRLRAKRGEEILAEHRDGQLFGMAKLSDGERNAAILGATVLTVDPGTLLLIDEPERHLHRSIIEPFLTALFDCRPDCPFIVSTHELSLPVAAKDARVLLPRGCEWSGESVHSWTLDVLTAGAELPDDLRHSILGSRRKILFVEGEHSSLDLPVYEALFNDVSVVPKGGCSEVIRAVKGLRSAESLHWVEATGLIDRDDREEKELSSLRDGGIHGLNVHSVESLYFSKPMRVAVAKRQAETYDVDPDDMLKQAEEAAMKELGQLETKKHLSARRIERKVRDAVMSQIPGCKEIKGGTGAPITIQVDSGLPEEIDRYEALLQAKDFDGLIARYPVRETNALTNLAAKLKFRPKENYEQAARAQLAKDDELVAELRKLLGTLTEALTGQSKAEVDSSPSPP